MQSLNFFLHFHFYSAHYNEIFVLDSERSDKCIYFTMMCVFFIFVSVYTISRRNKTSIFNFSILFDGKVNLVGWLGGEVARLTVGGDTDSRPMGRCARCLSQVHVTVGPPHIFTTFFKLIIKK